MAYRAGEMTPVLAVTARGAAASCRVVPNFEVVAAQMLKRGLVWNQFYQGGGSLWLGNVRRRGTGSRPWPWKRKNRSLLTVSLAVKKALPCLLVPFNADGAGKESSAWV